MVDRHTHLEGSLEPSWIKEQAKRKGLAVPPELEALWQNSPLPFDSFITAFSFGCELLCNANAVREAVRAAVRRLPPKLPGIPRGIDMWVSPHFLVKQARLITLDALWNGINEGILEAKRSGVHIAIIIDAVNHLGIDQGHEVLDLILNDKPSWVVGFSTGGLESIAFKEWAPVFERARHAGLLLAAHAGENGPAMNVQQAVIHAGVERIVHGVRAAEHPKILELLVERNIPVDICITSNCALVPKLGNHPLPKLLRAGVRCALGTDDPGVIPCTLGKEWLHAKALGLESEELKRVNYYSNADAWCFKKLNAITS
jgi:adenosine deaminase